VRQLSIALKTFDPNNTFSFVCFQRFFIRLASGQFPRSASPLGSAGFKEFRLLCENGRHRSG
jgi:hypothetical protein